jgi:hypothetical protein
VRFWVRSETGVVVGASIRKEILHHRFSAQANGPGALDSYRTHQTEIDAAVMRRIATGSIEPVMLRESDLPVPAKR